MREMPFDARDRIERVLRSFNAYRPGEIAHQIMLALSEGAQSDLCTLNECRAAPRCSSGATVWHDKTPNCGVDAC